MIYTEDCLYYILLKKIRIEGFFGFILAHILEIFLFCLVISMFWGKNSEPEDTFIWDGKLNFMVGLFLVDYNWCRFEVNITPNDRKLVYG